jgi:hypothetical protein
MTIYCPLMASNKIIEEKLFSFLNEHKRKFEENYKQISY